MENLQYIVDDNTIVELLGLQSFTSKESAILELVKNAYDAGAKKLIIKITPDSITITDNGCGMNEQEFKEHWLHIGKSNKGYDFKDEDGNIRIAAGAKGVGRFALARLGSCVAMNSKKNNFPAIYWSTDWTNSNNKLDVDNNYSGEKGTTFSIKYLRDAWNKKQVEYLSDYLSRTYNDDKMEIALSFNDETMNICRYFEKLKVGKNYFEHIELKYDAKKTTLTTMIKSDEFDSRANSFCKDIDINNYVVLNNIFNEYESNTDEKEKLHSLLQNLGNFTADFYFGMDKNEFEDKEKFLYKYDYLPSRIKKGVILYRNAFSISSFEGYKDWLQFGKRSRASTASPSHPTGSWKVRENQISGKIVIDKQENKNLQDLVNRQGLVENEYFNFFVKIIILGITNFERYRQSIIRKINVKNIIEPVLLERRIADEIVEDPKKIDYLNDNDKSKLVNEIISFQKNEKNFFEKEENYRSDIRLLNMLATVGLKASSIAHELNNDRNIISDNYDFIVEALKSYDMWNILNLPENTKTDDVNVPALLKSSKEISDKFLIFVDTLLTEIEKKQFKPVNLNIFDTITKIKNKWEKQYSWTSIDVNTSSSNEFFISEDVLNVIFDNLILNSIQQNTKNSQLSIFIEITNLGKELKINYKDTGRGLPPKYQENPMRILEPLETSREEEGGHGLGMWIVNNTLNLTGGNVEKIFNGKGFQIQFSIGEKM